MKKYGVYAKTTEDVRDNIWSVCGVFSTPEEAAQTAGKLISEGAFLRVEIADITHKYLADKERGRQP